MHLIEYGGYFFGAALGFLIVVLGVVMWKDAQALKRRRATITLFIAGCMSMLAALSRLFDGDWAMVLILASMTIYHSVLTEVALDLKVSALAKLALGTIMFPATAFLAVLAILRALEPSYLDAGDWEPSFFTAGWLSALAATHLAMAAAFLAEAKEVGFAD